MVKMEVSASAELEYSTSSVDGCESSRSSSLSCHKTGASVESEIRPSLLDMFRPNREPCPVLEWDNQFQNRLFRSRTGQPRFVIKLHSLLHCQHPFQKLTKTNSDHYPLV